MAKRKRSNAEGSIYKRESRDRWEASLVVGWKDGKRIGADGKPVRVPVRRTFTAKTRKAVEAKLREAMENRDRGLGAADPSLTLANFAQRWRTAILPTEGLAPATEVYYLSVLDLYIVPNIGHRTLTGPGSVTVGDIEMMMGALAGKGLSHRTQVGARTVTGKLLRAAERHGLTGRNVARLTAPPKGRGKAREMKALTPAEVAELLNALDAKPHEDGRKNRPRSRWWPVVVLGVTTGLRPGELLALHWDDVKLDGDEPHLSVRRSLSHVEGPTLKGPKRERSYRTVPLTPEAVAALKDWRKLQAAEQLAAGPMWSEEWPGLIFTSARGEPQRGDSFRHALQRAVPGVHPHRLRHSYATHLIEAGVPIAHVAELLGDTVAVVESTYSHVIRHKHEVTGVVSGLLSGKPS